MTEHIEPGFYRKSHQDYHAVPGGGRISIQAPKSGRQTEVAFVPQKLAHRLGEYIRHRAVEPKEKIFRISYPAARMVVKKAGELVGISLRPHDLRRHAATYASRSGTPIEIVSKVILDGFVKSRHPGENRGPDIL